MYFDLYAMASELTFASKEGSNKSKLPHRSKATMRWMKAQAFGPIRSKKKSNQLEVLVWTTQTQIN